MFSRSVRVVIMVGLVGAISKEAQADEEGWYAGVMGGVAGQSDQALLLDGASREEGSGAFSSGLLAGGSIGFAFGNGWRAEGEFAYQSVDRDNQPFTAPGLQGEGNYASTGFGLNVLYTFDLFGSPSAQTYLGAGFVVLTEVDIDFETPAGERSFSGDETAWQVLAGVRYYVGDHWYLDLGLRQLRASNLRLEAEEGAIGVVRGDYAPWAVTLGVGWRF